MKSEFKKFAVGLMLAAVLAAATFIGVNAVVKAADKVKPGEVAQTVDQLGTTGARVYYQLEDSEGGTESVYANGSKVRKVPAIVTFDPHGARGNDGRLIYSVRVFRPGFLGGAFDKDDVSFDPSRQPGSIDTFQEADRYR